MIVRDLRLGKRAIVRIYRNGIIIWEGGKKYAFGQLIAALTGFALVKADTPVSILMASEGIAGLKGTPVASDVIPGLLTSGKFIGTATPDAADTVNGAGKASMDLVMCARPTSGSMVFSRGQDGWEIHIVGLSEPADTVEGAGENTARFTTHGSSTAQEMESVLFSAKGELAEIAMPESADTLDQAMGRSSGELTMCARLGAWLEPVVVDGVLILRQAYSATVNNGVLEVR